MSSRARARLLIACALLVGCAQPTPFPADEDHLEAANPDAFPSPLDTIGIYRRYQYLKQFEASYPFKVREGLAELEQEPSVPAGP